jgi:hypothetical protein
MALLQMVEKFAANGGGAAARCAIAVTSHSATRIAGDATRQGGGAAGEGGDAMLAARAAVV